MLTNEPLDRPVDENEIEVTPEMIEAGEKLLYGYETETTDEAFWAEKLFKVMWAARNRQV